MNSITVHGFTSRKGAEEGQEYLTQSPQSPQRSAGIFEPCPAWLRGPSRANPHPAAAGIEYNGGTGNSSNSINSINSSNSTNTMDSINYFCDSLYVPN